MKLPPLKPVQTFCAMKVDDGPCRAFIKRYFFNILTHQCEEFIYGGCEGNENRFVSLEECEENCVRGRYLQIYFTQENSGLLGLILHLTTLG